MATALLFPGQGAPAPDWRGAVAELCPDLHAEACRLLGGADPIDRFGDGTEFDQPAIYCATLAAFEAAGRPRADFHAGHSMGEIPALACAGALSDRDGLRLVVERGRLMAAASRGAGAGSMLAVRAGAAQISATVDLGDVAIANLNSPSQTVLSGPTGSIERIATELGAAGAKAKRLAVTGGFHSPAMAPAAAGLERFLATIGFTAPALPVLSGRTGRPFADPRTELPLSLLEPVRWIDVVTTLSDAGVDRFREIGPGKALGGLVRKIVPGATTEASPIPEAVGA